MRKFSRLAEDSLAAVRYRPVAISPSAFEAIQKIDPIMLESSINGWSPSARPRVTH
jgi:hypothetical protein